MDKIAAAIDPGHKVQTTSSRKSRKYKKTNVQEEKKKSLIIIIPFFDIGVPYFYSCVAMPIVMMQNVPPSVRKCLTLVPLSSALSSMHHIHILDLSLNDC